MPLLFCFFKDFIEYFDDCFIFQIFDWLCVNVVVVVIIHNIIILLAAKRHDRQCSCRVRVQCAIVLVHHCCITAHVAAMFFIWDGVSCCWQGVLDFWPLLFVILHRLFLPCLTAFLSDFRSGGSDAGSWFLRRPLGVGGDGARYF